MSRRLLFALAVLLLAPAARAQIDIRIGLPTIRFEARPPVMVVEEGVQVVPDQPDEVFFVENAYWMRRDDVWYRSPDHRGRWVVMEPRRVPVTLVRIPPGKYRHWHGGGPAGGPPGLMKEKHGRGHGHGRH